MYSLRDFCPTPNKINDEQLLEYLDKWARSLRIKERDCSEDRSADSEDDNGGSPFLGKRENNHGFQNPAKIQLYNPLLI